MNTKSIWAGLAVLPLLIGTARADSALVGNYTTTGNNKANVVITLNGSGDHEGRVRLADGAEYSLRQAQSLNEEEARFKWVFVIQPAGPQRKTESQTPNVFRRNPAGIRDEAVRLLCLTPDNAGGLSAHIVARTKVQGPLRGAIPFTPFVFWVEPPRSSESITRHVLSLRKNAVGGLPVPARHGSASVRGRLIERDERLVISEFSRNRLEMLPLSVTPSLQRLLEPLTGQVVELQGRRRGSTFVVSKLTSPQRKRLRGQVSRREGQITLKTKTRSWALGGRLAWLISDGREVTVQGWAVGRQGLSGRAPLLLVTGIGDRTKVPSYRFGPNGGHLKKGTRLWVVGAPNHLVRVKHQGQDGVVLRRHLESSWASAPSTPAAGLAGGVAKKKELSSDRAPSTGLSGHVPK